LRQAGAFVFGGGLAIVPFLHGGVVNESHWLTERQLGVFLPCYLFVVIPAQWFHKFAQNAAVTAFVFGVTAAAGVIAGAALVVGRKAITDFSTLGVALATTFVILIFRKIPESVVILSAGFLGLMLHPA
jgi:chromate transporter